MTTFAVIMHYTINVGGELLDLREPRVMGILNATPDSFYAGSRKQTERDIAERANQIVAQGGDIIDVGACSTRPGSTPASEEEELSRLRLALQAVRREQPAGVVSVDTFRPDVARMAVEEYGAAIINDVSEGGLMQTAARLGVAYVLMSRQSTLETMTVAFARETEQLRSMGAKDIIIDPGFGFGKTMEENYAILSGLEKLGIFGLPILAGLSRKRMAQGAAGTDAAGALNATTALNTLALRGGASILRVHDVGEAVEVCKIYKYYSRDNTVL